MHFGLTSSLYKHWHKKSVGQDFIQLANILIGWLTNLKYSSNIDHQSIQDAFVYKKPIYRGGAKLAGLFWYAAFYLDLGWPARIPVLRII